MIIDEYDKEYDLCTKKLIEIPLGNTKLIPMDISFGNMLLDDVDVIKLCGFSRQSYYKYKKLLKNR